MSPKVRRVDTRGNVTTVSPELLGIEHPAYGTCAWGNVHTDSRADLLANPELYYVNVHSTTFAGGAVRGQLR